MSGWEAAFYCAAIIRVPHSNTALHNFLRGLNWNGSPSIPIHVRRRWASRRRSLSSPRRFSLPQLRKNSRSRRPSAVGTPDWFANPYLCQCDRSQQHLRRGFELSWQSSATPPASALKTSELRYFVIASTSAASGRRLQVTGFKSAVRTAQIGYTLCERIFLWPAQSARKARR